MISMNMAIAVLDQMQMFDQQVWRARAFPEQITNLLQCLRLGAASLGFSCAGGPPVEMLMTNLFSFCVALVSATIGQFQQ